MMNDFIFFSIFQKRPRHLKQRILSTLGHLSNDTAGHFLTELERLPEHIVLAHLSEHNNLPQLAHKRSLLFADEEE